MNRLWDAIAWLVVTTIHTADRIACWWMYWRCTECDARTWNIETHWQVDHADIERRAL